MQTVVAAVAFAGVIAMRHFGVACYAQAFLVVAAVLWICQLSMTEPDRHSVRRHAKISMIITLGLTWSFAVVAAAVATKVSPKETWVAMLLLSASSVGGFFALQRSARTRSETGAGLREITALRVTSLSVPLIEQSVMALDARRLDDLLHVCVRMLRFSVSLPLTANSHLVDKSALWVLDENSASWILIASSAADTREQLSFPTVTRPTLGAGIIPNLAVGLPADKPNVHCARDLFLCSKGVRGHAWFREAGGGTAEGMAVVLLRHDERLLGALSLTSRTPDAIPVTGSEQREMAEILTLWAKSFVVPLVRLYSLQEVSP